MHAYLKAVGLNSIYNRTTLDKLLGEVMTTPTNKCAYEMRRNERFVEFTKEFANGIGLTVRGHYDYKGFFHLEHYFPFLRENNISMKEKVFFNKKIDKTAYSGLCDNMKFGSALIFYLVNAVDYMKISGNHKCHMKDTRISLTGLCNDGKILLPVSKNNQVITRTNRLQIKKQRLIAEAKKGNQDALANLSINEIDMHEQVCRRKKYEDVYTIVNHSFYPYGSESDCYSIIGTIERCELITNSYTGEKIYKIKLNCNDVIFTVGINKNDLFGIPTIGARFKGNIWLQGYVRF